MYLFIIKNATHGQSNVKDAPGKYGRGCGASMPSPGVLLSKHFDVVTNPEALQIHHLKSFCKGIVVSGECVISSVLSHHSKNLKWWVGRCYSSVLIGKQRKRDPRGVRVGRPKRCEEKKSPWLTFGSSFCTFFLLPLSLPCVNWASQEGCFTWDSHSGPWTFLCSMFMGFSLSLSFSHCHYGLLFPGLTT